MERERFLLAVQDLIQVIRKLFVLLLVTKNCISESRQNTPDVAFAILESAKVHNSDDDGYVSDGFVSQISPVALASVGVNFNSTGVRNKIKLSKGCNWTLLAYFF